MGRTTLVGLVVAAVTLLAGTARAQSLVDLAGAMGTAGTLSGNAASSGVGAKGTILGQLPKFTPPKIDVPEHPASEAGTSGTAKSSGSTSDWKAGSSGLGSPNSKSAWTSAGKIGKSSRSGSTWTKAGSGRKTASAGNVWKAGGMIAHR